MKKLIFMIKKAVKRNSAITNLIRRIIEARTNVTKRKMADYFCENYRDLFEKYNALPATSTEDAGENGKAYPVWVCWFQGEESMPETIRMCYNSLLKNAGGRKVHLITLDNYSGFADIPEHIREKNRKGILSHTYLSEVLRACLLSKYGGLYIDATVYVSGELPSFDGMPFWTGKWNNGGKFARSKPFVEFLSYCLPGNILWCFLRDLSFDFWEKHDKLIDYHFFEVAIRCACEKIGAVRDMIDKVQATQQGIFDLYSLANLEYDPQKYGALCKEVRFHKLTYKEDFRKETKGGKTTFYGHLYQMYEKNQPPISVG